MTNEIDPIDTQETIDEAVEEFEEEFSENYATAEGNVMDAIASGAFQGLLWGILIIGALLFGVQWLFEHLYIWTH
jgi:hypothetical protein